MKVNSNSNKDNEMNQEEIIKELGKECFEPIIEVDEKNLNHTGSKYFGNVWLAKDEEWPTNENGDYLTFVLQLDIASLPTQYSLKLGGKGVLQFFLDIAGADYPSETLIRIVEPCDNGQYHTQPLNNFEFGDYLIDGKLPHQKIINSWKAHWDLPHHQEELNDDVSELVEALEDRDDGCSIQGDKLGGYAFWTQAGASSSELIFQFDAGCFYDGKHFEAHAPNLFAGDGTGHIFYCGQEEGEHCFDFDWACG